MSFWRFLTGSKSPPDFGCPESRNQGAFPLTPILHEALTSKRLAVIDCPVVVETIFD
jgi:hypothetical protein